MPGGLERNDYFLVGAPLERCSGAWGKTGAHSKTSANRALKSLGNLCSRQSILHHALPVCHSLVRDLFQEMHGAGTACKQSLVFLVLHQLRNGNGPRLSILGLLTHGFRNSSLIHHESWLHFCKHTRCCHMRFSISRALGKSLRSNSP